MKKKIVLSLLALVTLVSSGLLVGSAEAAPYNRYQANRWNHYNNFRIAQAQRYHYMQNRGFWNNHRPPFAPGYRPYQNPPHRWW
jgi:hypothetical protein